MNAKPRIEELVPGTKVVDIHSGPCTVRGLPYRTTPSSSEAVDVVGINWDGSSLPWTACVVNLRWP